MAKETRDDVGMKLIITCPFCKETHIQEDMEECQSVSIVCKCGALIQMGYQLEYWSAEREED